MRRTTIRRVLGIALMLAWGPGLASPAAGQCIADPVYYATGPNCGYPWGLTYTKGKGINSFHEAVGSYRKCPPDDPDTVAVRWTEETGLVELTGFPPGTTSSHANDINDSGQIVGSYEVSGTGLGIGFLIDGVEFISLGTFPNGTYSFAVAINEAGDIVGTAGNHAVGPVAAFLWRDGRMQTLDGAPEGVTTRANDINDQGQIAGEYYPGGAWGPGQRAFVWEDGNFTDLGVVPGAISVWATAINNHGHVVGTMVIKLPNDETITRPFVWIDGQMMEIEFPQYITSCGARDINDAGQVLLSCGYLWQAGVLYYLQDLVGREMEIETLAEISNDGTMVGRMTVPVDEPDDPDGFASALGVVTFPTPPPGDLTGDCCIGPADLAIILGNWGPAPPGDPIADLDDDGIVGPADLAILLGNWGPCE